MAENIFGHSSPAPAVRELRSESAEPRLFPVSRTVPADPPVADPGPRISNADPGPPAPFGGWESIASPTLSVTDRPTPARGEPSTGTLLSLALVGLVATAIIGAFFSVGLLLLSGPARQNLAASEPVSAHVPAQTPPDSGAPGPAPANTAATPTGTAPAKAGTAPAASVPPQPAAAETKPLPPAGPVQAAAPPPVASSPPPPQSLPVASSAPPPPPVPAPKPASIPAVLPAAMHNASAVPTSSPVEKTADSHMVRHPRLRHLRSEHARIASRDAHLRSSREGATAAPRQSDNAQSLSPPPDQTQSFNQLISQLTGQARAPDQAPPAHQVRPANPLHGQSLTPPSADQPDPFAGR